MRRYRATLLTLFLAGIITGCSENQPNAPAKPEEVNADFGAKTADMMKNANTGMDPKKKAATPAPK